MTKVETDERLMHRLACGDEDALGELMRRTQSAVWCFVARMVRSPELADDICQDVWTRLYLYRESYDSYWPFRNYLFTIAANCCRSALRKRGARRGLTAGADHPPEELPSSDPAPEQGLSAAEERAELHRAIDRLPELQRAVVLLYLLCSSNYRHIAAVTGRSESTVRSQMCRALRRLRDILTKTSLAADWQVDHD